jgi:hypothetical protein
VVELQKTPVNVVDPGSSSSVALPGAFGLNVTACAVISTAVHCVLDGHAMANRKRELLSIGVGVGVPGELGLNVTSFPLSSTAVHCVLDTHATAYR